MPSVEAVTASAKRSSEIRSASSERLRASMSVVDPAKRTARPEASRVQIPRT